MQKIPVPKIDSELLRSFGRIKGRKLSDAEMFLVDNILPKYKLDIDKPLDFKEIFDFTPKRVFLEIGFGSGEHLLHQAKNNPDMVIIGCEPFINGVVKLLKKIEDEGIENIRIFHGDARILLQQLPKNCVDRAFILFPDPWPKKKHHKKRLINQGILNELASVIKNNGTLLIATDHKNYLTSVLANILQSDKFYWTAKEASDWKSEPKDWTKTKYQLKAEREGRQSTFLNLALKN